MNEWAWNTRGMIQKTEVPRKKPVPVPLCPPQTLHAMAWY